MVNALRSVGQRNAKSSALPSQKARFMGLIWNPSGPCWSQMGPILAPWTLLSGLFSSIYVLLILDGMEGVSHLRTMLLHTRKCCVLLYLSTENIPMNLYDRNDCAMTNTFLAYNSSHNIYIFLSYDMHTNRLYLECCYNCFMLACIIFSKCSGIVYSRHYACIKYFSHIWNVDRIQKAVYEKDLIVARKGLLWIRPTCANFYTVNVFIAISTMTIWVGDVMHSHGLKK